MIAVMQIPQMIVLTYDQAALAAGDSRRFFVLTVAKALAMIGCLIVGLELGGLTGALLSIGVAMVFVYPVVVWLARHMQAWDPFHDMVTALAGLAIAALALWWNWDAIAQLAQLGG